MTVKKQLIIATKNAGKSREFRQLFGAKGFMVKDLNDFDQLPEVEETGTTFLENALIKARTIGDYLNLPVLADDSGLEVVELNGAPGVHSARYAGDHDDVANNRKLLAELASVPAEKRQAKFHTTLVLRTPKDDQLITDGEVNGEILTAPRGENGFGYDPLFYVLELKQTMAQLSATQKNQISHRGRATEAMLQQIDQWWEANA